MGRVFLDYDDNSSWFMRERNPLWSSTLELIRIEAKRLANLFPLGNKAIILRSDNGFHLRFPKARLSRDEEESVMWVSKSHYGHKCFSSLVEDTTLRVSRKPEKDSHRPYLVEVIEL